MNPHQVTKDFEAAIARYTGAPYAIAVNSCTAALLMALAWFKHLYGPHTVEIPRFTYVGVGMSVLNAGHAIAFRDEDWQGEYRLEPLPLYDSARRTTAMMYRPGAIQCLSLHWSKILGVQQGGVLLLDDPAADTWLRRARFDGRREGVHPRDDTFDMVGFHCYLSPEVAAEALMRLSILPRVNPDLPRSDYSDLSLAPIFAGNPAKCLAQAAE